MTSKYEYGSAGWCVHAQKEIRRLSTELSAAHNSIIAACDGTLCMNAHELRLALDGANEIIAELVPLRAVVEAVADLADLTAHQNMELVHWTKDAGCTLVPGRVEVEADDFEKLQNAVRACCAAIGRE